MSNENNVYQFLDLPRAEPEKIALSERRRLFKEIYAAFDSEQAAAQADRCLSCGNPYCQHKCPLHNNIPDWLRLAKEGRIIEAAALADSTNTLPEVCGRVCPQERLCEGSCTLHEEFGAVTIGHIETYITEEAFKRGWKPGVKAAKTGKKAAVIGAGPAGLACADGLIRQGVDVTVFERQPAIGGLLTFGIPAFKLDKSVMQRRYELFCEMGIDFRLGVEIGRDIALAEMAAQYDAVFVAVGAYRSIKADIPGEEAEGVYAALPYLIANTKQLLGLPSPDYADLKGRRVVVLGGGDTAMDCLRTAQRQGADSVICVYRRDAANMPGSTKEYANAREEGVEFSFQAQPLSIEGDAVALQHGAQGGVSGVKIRRTQLGPPDAQGRRQVQIVEGSEEIIACDAVIVAFGFAPHEMPWLQGTGVQVDAKGRIALEGQYAQQTANEKIFAGGDVTRGSDLVVTAIAEGRRAAQGILAYLGV